MARQPFGTLQARPRFEVPIRTDGSFVKASEVAPKFKNTDVAQCMISVLAMTQMPPRVRGNVVVEVPVHVVSPF